MATKIPFLSVVFSIATITVLFVACSSIQHPHHERGLAEQPSASKATPQLFIQTAPIFDSECQERTNFKIDPTWQLELSEKLPRFQSSWDEKAGALISASESAAGRVFSRKEYSVALTVCRWTPMGDPALIVSARPYLDGPANADKKIGRAKSMTTFVSMVHHELLHSLVDNLGDPAFYMSSPMLKKFNEHYHGQHFKALVHLHLMAIQKAAYEKLGETALLKASDDLYASIGEDYKLAWDFVNGQGAKPFLDELQAFNSRKK